MLAGHADWLPRQRHKCVYRGSNDWPAQHLCLAVVKMHGVYCVYAAK